MDSIGFHGYTYCSMILKLCVTHIYIYILKSSGLLKKPDPIENIAAIINNMPHRTIRAKILLCLYALPLTETNTPYRPNRKSVCPI